MRNNGQGKWKTELKPSSTISAGAKGIWTLDIYPDENLNPGDAIRFSPDFLKARWNIGEFFFTTAANCSIEHRRIYPFLSKPGVSNASFMEAEITDGTIKAGELIRLYMGNYSKCGKECVAPSLVVENAFANILFHSKNEKGFRIVSTIIYNITPGKTSRISAHFTSPVSDKSDICVSSLDKFDNMTICNEKLILFAIDSSGKKHRLESIELNDGRARLDEYELPRLDYPALLYAELESNKTIHSVKVPFCLGFASRDIYFGELHLHSAGSHCDGMNSPEFVYDYARYVSGMAFCAITDHVGMIRDDFWTRQRKVAKKSYKPGSFVPILGYEWDSDWEKGHTGVFVKGDLPFIVKGDSIEELWRNLDRKGCEFFTRPNHVNSVAEHLPLVPLENLQAWKNYDWYQHNDKHQPLVEIVTPRGSSEKEDIGNGVLLKGYGSSVESALKAGHHIGFCGGSDDHTGRPGNIPENNWLIRKEKLHTGITAVLAGKLNMDSLWDALVNRNTYATTGAKILLDFRVNELIMGQKKKVGNNVSAEVKLQVVGTDEIISVVIIRNGETLKEYRPLSHVFSIRFVDELIAFAIPCKDGNSGHAYYYARVIQRNGHIAWSSPIYLCHGEARG